MDTALARVPSSQLHSTPENRYRGVEMSDDISGDGGGRGDTGAELHDGRAATPAGGADVGPPGAPVDRAPEYGTEPPTLGEEIGIVDATVSGERILITGGAGFIGSHLAEYLARQNDVRVLDNLATGTEQHLADDVDFVRGSVTDSDLVTDVTADRTVVIHMAAMMGVQRTLENPLDVLEVNMDGTRAVLSAAQAAAVDRVLFTSTSEVYGDRLEPPYSEDDPLSPKTNYAVSKCADERYVRAFCEEAGIDYTVLRYFNVYGPRQESSEYGFVVPRFVEQALNRAELRVHGDGSQTRDFTYVDDAIDSTLRALGPAGANETFNVGTGHEVSIAELAETVVDVVGSGEISFVDHPRPYRVSRRCADVGRASRELAYEPEIGLEAGVAKLANVIAR